MDVFALIPLIELSMNGNGNSNSSNGKQQKMRSGFIEPIVADLYLFGIGIGFGFGFN